MKNKYFVLFICLCIFLIIISISVVIYSNTSKNRDSINDKINQEIEYVEIKLIGMINSLNSITFSNSVLLEQNTINTKDMKDAQNQNKSNNDQNNSNSNNQKQDSSNEQNEKSSDYTKYSIENRNILIQEDKPIDWGYLKNNVEVLYSTWPTIMIDLNTAGVENEDILLFSNTLDQLVIDIEREDKLSCLNDLSVLYSLLPKYIEKTTEDLDKINIFYTKSCIINCYVLLEEDKWPEIQEQINKASDYFKTILNSTEIKNEQSLISKIYISLNEMKNTIKFKDKKLFYLKYVNFMESALEH